MTKRNFRDVSYEREMKRNEEYTANQRFHMKKYKNSLDSDEDDDEEEAIKLNVMDPRYLEGEEERTIEFDGEIKITPFNMKEELEEGHFDKDGTYIFHSNEDEIKDNWLDNIDWVKVENQKNFKKRDREDDSDDDTEEIDVTSIYREMLELMHPKETVQRAIKRLAGKGVSASNKWSKKNRVTVEQANTSEEDREKFTRLSGLADKIIQTGDMDIYQQTYERLQFLLKKSDRKEDKVEDEEEPLDMFADEVDSSKLNNPTVSENTPAEGESPASARDQVMWEFKWDNEDNSTVYGPHPTSEMQRWVDEGYFSDEIFVRRVGNTDSRFYSSRRIDFELYM